MNPNSRLTLEGILSATAGAMAGGFVGYHLMNFVIDRFSVWQMAGAFIGAVGGLKVGIALPPIIRQHQRQKQLIAYLRKVNARAEFGESGLNDVMKNLKEILTFEDFYGICRTTKTSEIEGRRYPLRTRYGTVNILVDEVSLEMESMTNFKDQVEVRWGDQFDRTDLKVAHDLCNRIGWIKFTSDVYGHDDRLVFLGRVKLSDGRNVFYYENWENILAQMALRVTTAESLLKEYLERKQLSDTANAEIDEMQKVLSSPLKLYS